MTARTDTYLTSWASNAGLMEFPWEPLITPVGILSCCSLDATLSSLHGLGSSALMIDSRKCDSPCKGILATQDSGKVAEGGFESVSSSSTSSSA